jgi:hypothetical protein
MQRPVESTSRSALRGSRRKPAAQKSAKFTSILPQQQIRRYCGLLWPQLKSECYSFSSFPILSGHFARIPSQSLFNVYLTCLLAAASSSDTILKSQLSSNLALFLRLGPFLFTRLELEHCSVPSFFVPSFSQTIISPSVDFGCNHCMIYLVLLLFWFYYAAVCPTF